MVAAWFILLVSLESVCGWSVQVGKDIYHYNAAASNEPGLKRQKREWVVPPVMVREHEDNSRKNPICKIHSDKDEPRVIPGGKDGIKQGGVGGGGTIIVHQQKEITYIISGEGVDQAPFGVFVMDPLTGYMNITRIVDREVNSQFLLTARAVNRQGKDVEKPLELRVRVMDINDNYPVFMQNVFVAGVEELSAANTLVMQILATDADEENNLNSKIAYKIISQTPDSQAMFIMNQYTGEVFTVTNSLDREEFSSYSLEVGGSDLNGGAGGLSSQCGATIKIIDVNDNFPTLDQQSYSVSISENALSDGLLWMQVYDADEEFSANWLGKFNIVSGNEGGWFVIETDQRTNMGVLKVVKTLDYESMQSVNLGFVLMNQASFHSSIASQYQGKVTPISVTVNNVKEGYKFQPSTKYFIIPAGLTGEALFRYVLGSVQVMDMDTGKPATNIRYMKGKDVMNWISVDSTTGEVRVVKDMTRDSSSVINGTYYAEVLAISDDVPSRTATGTIAINVPDTNHYCPTISSTPRVTCLDTPYIDITAYDKDPAPYGAPFKFRLENTPGSNAFTLQQLNATTARLQALNTQPLFTNVTVSVSDNSNLSCSTPFTLPVQLCDCINNRNCDTSRITGRDVTLGPAAIGLMILGALMLLLVPLLLLLCNCGAGAGGGFVPVSNVCEGELHPWTIEGAQPEDRDVSHMVTSAGPMGNDYMDSSDTYTNTFLVGGAATGAGAAAGAATGAIAGAHYGAVTSRTAHTSGDGGGYMTSGMRANGFSAASGRGGSMGGGTLREYREGEGLNAAFLDGYFTEKSEFYANEDEGRPANDCLLIYDNEGVGSPVGSIGCCSFIDDDLDDSYLDGLGPKFKTLAEICTGKSLEPEPSPMYAVPNITTDTNYVMSESSTLVRAEPAPAPVVDSTFISESAYSSRAEVPHIRPMPEPAMSGNVLVTETYTTTGPAMPPPTLNRNPRLQPGNVVVEEIYTTSGASMQPPMLLRNSRLQPNVVVTDTLGRHGMLDIPDVGGSSNVVVTERVIRPASGLHNMVDMSDLGDGSNVIMRERVTGPNISRSSNAFSFPDIGDAQNVVVTERVIQPASGFNGNFSSYPDLANAQNVYVTEKTTVSGAGNAGQMLSQDNRLSQSVGAISHSAMQSSGSGVTGQMLNPEAILNQAIGAPSPNTIRRVTKYSTVQYSNQ